MKKYNNRKDLRLRVLRRMRNLGWAFTAIGGGVIGLPELGLLERLAVYSIVAGTFISVGSQALINEIRGRDGDMGSPEDGFDWPINRNK